MIYDTSRTKEDKRIFSSFFLVAGDEVPDEKGDDVFSLARTQTAALAAAGINYNIMERAKSFIFWDALSDSAMSQESFLPFFK